MNSHTRSHTPLRFHGDSRPKLTLICHVGRASGHADEQQPAGGVADGGGGGRGHMQRRRRRRRDEEGGRTYRGGSVELRGDGGVFLSSRLPAAQQRQEELREGGSVVGLHGRVEPRETRKMEGWRGCGV